MGQKKLAKRNQVKLYECYCPVKSLSRDAAQNHASSSHPRWHYTLCVKGTCVRTIKKVGEPHECKPLHQAKAEHQANAQHYQ